MAAFGINNSGVININTDTKQTLSVNNLGTINVSSTATPTPATFELANILAGSGTINITLNGTLQVDVAASGNIINFGDATGGLTIQQLSSFGPLMVINGLQAGDTISIPSLPVGFTESYSAGILTLKSAGGTTLGTLKFGGTLPSATVVRNAVLACFVSGTRIATPDGLRRVETLKTGDHVRVRDGGAGQIEWVGHRHVDCRHHPKPENVRPFRIAAHAFRRGIPNRDLWLSPDHAVFVDDVLIPVKYLDNGTTIRQIKVREATYHHFELRDHAIVQAEGLTVETLLPGSDKTGFATDGNVVQLYPNFATRNWDAMGCAPLVVTGYRFEAVLRRLDRRAAAIGPWCLRRAS